MLGSVAVLLGATGLGFIPVPTPAGHATIMHVPAILGGVIEGPVVGLLVGLIFGIFSFLRATNPLFADPLVAIIPRLFIGVFSYFAYQSTRKINQNFSLLFAGVVGTVTNTVLVLGLAVLRGYIPFSAALPIAGVQGLPEAVLAAVLVAVVARAVMSMKD